MMKLKSYSLPTPECPDTLSDETIIDWLENRIQNWFLQPTTTLRDPFYQLLDLVYELKILLVFLVIHLEARLQGPTQPLQPWQPGRTGPQIRLPRIHQQGARQAGGSLIEPQAPASRGLFMF